MKTLKAGTVVLLGLVLAAPAVFDPAQAAEARIDDFKFECRTPDGKRLKPKHGDIDGTYFIDLPGQRAACLAAVDRKIAWCHENTVFKTNTESRKYAECLPIFQAQARDCAAFFRNERPKCDAGGAGAAKQRNASAAPDPWGAEGGGSEGSEWDPPSSKDAGFVDVGGSKWDPPATERAPAGSRKQTAARPAPAPAADADEDASSYSAALAEIMGEAPPGKASEEDYTAALAALERKAAEQRREVELEMKREEALRAEKEALREMEQEAKRKRNAARLRNQREAEYEATRAARRSNNESLQKWGNTFMEMGQELQRQRQAEERRRERRQQHSSGSGGGGTASSCCGPDYCSCAIQ